LFSDFAPALLAYWQVFAFNLDVEFDVFAFTSVSPRVFTMFHFLASTHLVKHFAFKSVAKTTVWYWGEVSESKTLYVELENIRFVKL
jgi:hypothetical protein